MGRVHHPSDYALALSPPAQSEIEGGLGGTPRFQVADRELAIMAIRKGWPVADVVRRKVVAGLVGDLRGGKVRDRHRAIRLLAMLNAQNLADLHHQEGSRQQVEHIDRGAELAGAASILGELRRLASAPGGEPGPRALEQGDQPAAADTGSDSPSPQPADDAGSGI